MNLLDPAATPHAPADAGDGVLPADVRRISLAIVNAYLIGPPGAATGRWVLVDAGLSPTAGGIAEAAAERFGPWSRPAAVVLTHGHFDHVGAAAALAARWDVPVYAHRAELPYLTGRSAYPPPDPTVGGLMAFLSPVYSRGPVDLGDRVKPLPAGGSVPGLAGWRWVPTPGHTPGHVSLFRDADRCLIAGDAFVCTRQEEMYAAVAHAVVVGGPPAYFTPDWQSARRSVAALAALRPRVAATGHGLPVAGETLRRGLGLLARRFDAIAVPPTGRYVNFPAIADQTGVVYVPPSAMDFAPAAAAAAAGFAIGYLTHGRKPGDRRA